MLTYYTATADLPCGIHAGDTISLNDENPAEPVLVHRPVKAGRVEVEAWVAVGVLRPVSSSASPAVSPPPSGRPRLRLLRSDEQSA